MKFEKRSLQVDVSDIRKMLNEKPDLFGRYDLRTSGNSPHRESKDIWFRFVPAEKLSGATHLDIIWMPESLACPSVYKIVNQVVEEAGCYEIGGVLCTKLPPGAQIYPHTDNGWHAERYRKFYVPIQSDEGCKFVFEGEEIPAKEGDVYEFDNRYEHWVKNESNRDRIALIVCAR